MAKTTLDEMNRGASTVKSPDDPYYPAFLKEASAYEQILPELLSQCPGWFVAVHGEEVIDRDRDELSLARRVGRLHPSEFVLIRCVEPGPERDALMDSPEGLA